MAAETTEESKPWRVAYPNAAQQYCGGPETQAHREFPGIILPW